MISQNETNSDSEGLALGFVRRKGEALANEELGSGEARDKEAFVVGSACHSKEEHPVGLVLPGSDA